MKLDDLLNPLRRSFSARISLAVVLFTTILLVLVQLTVSICSRHMFREEAIRGATQSLQNIAIQLDNIISDVMLEANYTEWLLYRHLDEPESILEYSRTAVQGNTFLNGCSIAFKPDYFPGQHYFSAYSCRVGDTVRTIQEGNDDYQYFYKDWFLMPQLLNHPCWTEPYSDWDEDDDPRMQSDALVSYCKPLTDMNGEFIGVLTMDISLRWLSRTMSTVKPYPNSYCVLISRGGSYIVHPDPKKLLHQSIFTQELVQPDPKLHALGLAMTGWEEGMQEIKLDGKRNYVFYKPLRETGWSVGIVCPHSDIFGRFSTLRIISRGVALLSLLLLFLVCSRLVGRTVKPLSTLAEEAEKIAAGDFEGVLPEVNRADEIGTLSRSFAHMQTSLVSYIDELTSSTEKRVRIEGELQIARDIQMGMLPRTFPAFPDRKDIDLYASITPAREVGGDLYDYFIQNDKLYFCLGDVSGKGIPASLFMSVTRTLFGVLGQQELPPCEIARQINESLSEGNDLLMFVTLFIGVIDLKRYSLSFCNCGHNPPVLLRKDGPVFLECLSNTAIGVSPGFAFEGQEIADVRGLPIFLYTDGLNEAENPCHEQFGNDRLMKVLKEGKFESAMDLIRKMQDAVAAHVGDAAASDDLTMLCLKVG